ncbi:MAG TPA: hypothetical protein VHO90_22570 [Bacteroidales bacterium]|nr:hypothetical protein [Bacteroidales bacterium]
MNKLVLILFAVAAITISSCKKGDDGPVGPKGDTGEVGPAGKDGSVMFAGSTAPDNATGKEGDYYLDKTACLLYGPKTSTGWGTGLNVKGDKGADGCKILKGDGAPAESLGNPGDFYLDKTNFALYGPKLLISIGGAKLWGAGLQLGAPIQTYIITNPFDYALNASSGSIEIPLTALNLTATQMENNLALVFLKTHESWHLAAGAVGYASSFFIARYNYDPTGTGIYIYLLKNDGTSWGTLDGFKNGTNLQAIKVAIIPQGKLTTVSALANKSYDDIMKVLLKD